jgi:hypothetical protein
MRTPEEDQRKSVDAAGGHEIDWAPLAAQSEATSGQIN